mgnify:CR=1 FL=1
MSNDENLLFICSRNQWRSPTAEKVFIQKGFSARSAGTSPNAKRTVSVNDIKWSSHIFVMEKKHKQRLIAKFTRLLEYKKIVVLDIPDEYQYMDQELVNILNDSIEHNL